MKTSYHLLEVVGVPDVNVSVEGECCNLLKGFVEGEGAHLLCRLALLDGDGLDSLVARQLGRARGGLAVILHSPQGHASVARAWHQELVVQPAHVEHPVTVCTLHTANRSAGRHTGGWDQPINPLHNLRVRKICEARDQTLSFYLKKNK